MQESDVLIAGAGIIGLSIARELQMRYPGLRIHILEKEKDVARHSSGRNSGVLHAGFYYNADSLKARFTRQGNQEMKAFCRTHQLPLSENGKVVVAQNADEVGGIDELYRRGQANGVPVSIVDEKALQELEPNARTTEKALYSPSTATVDPEAISLALRRELEQQGVQLFFDEGFAKNISAKHIQSTRGRKFRTGVFINAAGLYADRIARQYGFSQDYTILPFKGTYLKYTFSNPPVKMNIYPVPNLNNPFLGVHFTVTTDQQVKIGPTSIPAFWRENYQGLEHLKGRELLEILSWESRLFLSNAFGFRDLAVQEVKKYRKSYFVDLASQLVKRLNKNGFTQWTRPGIRAQLLDIHTHELVQDFVVEGDKDSIHVLNAVSPAFTSSFPFARWVVDRYLSDR